jgi:hypothetical protein
MSILRLMNKPLAPCRLGVVRARTLQIAHRASRVGPGGPVVMSWSRAEVETGMPPTSSRFLRLSTETLPEWERFSAVREEFAQKILKTAPGARASRSISYRSALLRSAPAAAPPTGFIRYNHHLKDCSDGFRLDIVARGPLQLSHAGEERTYDVWLGPIFGSPTAELGICSRPRQQKCYDAFRRP